MFIEDKSLLLELVADRHMFCPRVGLMSRITIGTFTRFDCLVAPIKSLKLVTFHLKI